jgi:competence protein ComEC
LETAVAQLLTAPVICYIFGRLSIIGLFANVLVLPFVPLAMLLALIAGLAGMLLPAFGGLLALPGRVLLTYMLDIAGIFARLPLSQVPLKIAWQELLASYGFIILGCVLLHWRNVRTARLAWYNNREDTGASHYVRTQ